MTSFEPAALLSGHKKQMHPLSVASSAALSLSYESHKYMAESEAEELIPNYTFLFFTA